MCSENVVDYLLYGKDPRRIALQGCRADYTYGAIDAASAEFASRLLEAGAEPGDRILVLGANSFHWIAAYLGTLRARMVCVPLAGTIDAAELAYILESTQPRFAYVPTLRTGRAYRLPAVAQIPSLHGTQDGISRYFDGPEGRPLRRRADCSGEPSPPDLAALMFTSGSTGQPRGVMITHRNIIANTRAILASLPLQGDDRMMAVLPFHYCFGTSLLHTSLRVGATLLVETAFTYPELVLERMQRGACTSFAGVPSHYQILLRNSTLTRRTLPHLRSLLQAGGHLAPPFLRELQQALPQARIFVMYGQTEATARLACLDPALLPAKAGSIGKAIPGVTLRLINAAGNEAGPGEVGEIVAEGESIALGYWRAPEDTALTFREGRLYTGDLATRDAEGYLYIADRAREFVKCGGTRISCRHVEDCLLACEELTEAAVIGVPDEVLGEAVRAFVVPRPNAAPRLEERLRRFCRARLSHSLVPRDILVVSSLPKNSAGKVLRWRLKMSPQYAPESTAGAMTAQI